MTFVAQSRGNELTQFLNRLLRVCSFRDQDHLVVTADFQCHQRSDAACVSETLSKLELDFALETLGDVREHGRRARMQPGGIWNDDGVRGHGGPRRSGSVSFLPNECKFEKRVGAGLDHS